jgi:CelD/BcsL family acetyltransferase involved in cellulose biosynthesis
MQEGFDITDVQSSYGQMLRALVFKHIIENGGVIYDFLGGISIHKKDWGTSPAKIIHYTVAQRSIRGRIYLKTPELRELLGKHGKKYIPSPLLKK